MNITSGLLVIAILLNGYAAGVSIFDGGRSNYGMAGVSIAFMMTLNTLLSKVWSKEE